MADTTVETPATTEAEGSDTNAEPSAPIDFAEVFERSRQQATNGEGGAAEAATTETETSAAAAITAEPGAETTAETNEETTAEHAEKAAFYSQADLDAMRPGEFVHLDMQRVPKELRGIIGAAKAAIARGFQEAADARKTKQTERTESEQPEGEKRFTDTELYEMAMEGPEGHRKSQEIFLRQALPNLLKEIGVDPEVSAKQTDATRLTEVIASVAASSVKALNDPEFMTATGAELRSDQKLATELQNAVRSGDRETAEFIVELAARRAQAKVVTKPATQAEVKKPVTESRATKAATQLTASAAARSTTRGPQTKAATKTYDSIWDESREKLTAKA